MSAICCLSRYPIPAACPVTSSIATLLQVLGERSGSGNSEWLSGQGYGFIAPDDATADVFVHHSAIETDGYHSLHDNQRVEYRARHAVEAAIAKKRGVPLGSAPRPQQAFPG